MAVTAGVRTCPKTELVQTTSETPMCESCANKWSSTPTHPSGLAVLRGPMPGRARATPASKVRSQQSNVVSRETKMCANPCTTEPDVYNILVLLLHRRLLVWQRRRPRLPLDPVGEWNARSTACERVVRAPALSHRSIAGTVDYSETTRNLAMHKGTVDEAIVQPSLSTTFHQ